MTIDYDSSDLKSPSANATVKRDGQLDLSFYGWIIGSRMQATPRHEKGTQVRVYLTNGGHLVTAVKQWTDGPDSEKKRVSRRAAVHESPSEALAWLIRDGRGRLGPSSKAAWGQACQAVPSLAQSGVELVE